MAQSVPFLDGGDLLWDVFVHESVQPLVDLQILATLVDFEMRTLPFALRSDVDLALLVDEAAAP